MATSESMLEVSSLEVRYGSVPAVRGVDLRVDRGEIVGLIGPNGAGKSTTLHAIMGAVRPAAGDIRLAGTSIVGRLPERVVREGVALVPEGRRIFAELTVEENLRLGLSGRRTREGAEKAVEAVYELFPVVEETKGRQAGLLQPGERHVDLPGVHRLPQWAERLTQPRPQLVAVRGLLGQHRQHHFLLHRSPI